MKPPCTLPPRYRLKLYHGIDNEATVTKPRELFGLQSDNEDCMSDLLYKEVNSGRATGGHIEEYSPEFGWFYSHANDN